MEEDASNQPLRQLTVDDVRKLLKVEGEILQIVMAGKVGVPGSRLDSPSGVAEASSGLDANPEAARALASVAWTGRDFWLTFLATHAAVTGLLPFVHGRERVDADVWSANRQLLRELPPDVADSLTEWKRVRFGD